MALSNPSLEMLSRTNPFLVLVLKRWRDFPLNFKCKRKLQWVFGKMKSRKTLPLAFASVGESWKSSSALSAFEYVHMCGLQLKRYFSPSIMYINRTYRYTTREFSSFSLSHFQFSYDCVLLCIWKTQFDFTSFTPSAAIWIGLRNSRNSKNVFVVDDARQFITEINSENNHQYSIHFHLECAVV